MKKTLETDIDLKAVMKKLEELHMTIHIQSDHISQLEKQNQNLQNTIATDVFNSEKKQDEQRFLAPETPSISPDNIAAFYAFFLAKDIPSPSAHRILTFDKVITNAGNDYHPNTGTFIAPRSGLYVFTWTIRMYGVSYHTTELLVNNNFVGSTHLSTNIHMDDSVTGTVVVHVDEGNGVLLRTADIPNGGDIISRPEGRSSFVGWSLA
ncbi:heavy metal-binding protein HIP-like [Saccostrea echinata]|uniref:heavy metal-binding protein HIP-like n=1 Tax=Saccostrea echinata TaxID=191078 RepID=UPI002A805775|nr:heavy metal-binding protein HIP-like [Saccostrea echinata]